MIPCGSAQSSRPIRRTSHTCRFRIRASQCVRLLTSGIVYPIDVETEAALLQFATELRYAALALPKLDVVTVNELFGVFLRGVVVGTKNLYHSDEVAVRANDVSSILCHRIWYHPEVPVLEHKNPIASVHFCTQAKLGHC